MTNKVQYFNAPSANLVEKKMSDFLASAPPKTAIWISVCSGANILLFGQWAYYGFVLYSE